MARSTPVQLPTPPKRSEEELPPGYGPMYFIAIPGLTYKAISDAAAQRNMTVAEVISRAFSEFLKKTGD